MRRLATLGLIIAAAALSANAQFSITTESLSPATIGQVYNFTLTSSGDPGPVVWSFSGSAIPGFTLGSGTGTSGSLCSGACNSGSPVQTPAGNYPCTLVAHSLATNMTTSADFILVVQNPLQITTTSLPNASANQPYTAQLQGFGGSGQLVWSLQAGSFPLGISLIDVSKGVLGGTAPGLNGVYPFTIQLTDQVTQVAVTQTLSITVINGISIVTTSLPNATVNQPYQFALQGTGNSLVWSIPPRSQFPQGFSLSASGVITGVGTSTGSVSFPVQLASAQAPTATLVRLLTLFVTLGPLSIAETTLPSATQNAPYSAVLTPSGGIPPYTWSLGVSNLQGLSISSNGTISGALSTSGSFPVLVTLMDSIGETFTQNYTLNVGNAVSITTTSLPNSPPNVAYTATLAAAGGSVPYHWSVLSGILPTGLTLIPASGQISGTPTAQGAFQLTIQVTDSIGGTATKTFTITIGTVQPLIISTTTLPGASLNQAYNQTLASTGGTQPVTWSLTSGNPPTGLTLNPSTGTITGTPTVLQTASFSVQALDSARLTATRSFSITVASPVTISAAGFTTSVGVATSQTVTASGGIPPYTFSISPVSAGSLPGGLQIGASTGVISGTPNATGTFPVSVRATDTDGRFADAAITITVNSLALTIGAPSTTNSGLQPGIGVSVPTPAPGALTGTLSLAFTSSVGGTDDMVRFSNGSRSLAFTIPNGSTTAPNATIVTGTVAGTITLTASVPGSPDVTINIVIAPAAPVISSVTLQQVTGGLNVVVSGYSNTREVSSGSFTFTVSGGSTVQVTVPLTSAYAAWFGNSTSNATGGQFKLSVPFSVTQGSAASITKVSVTLTNGQGTSTAVSSP